MSFEATLQLIADQVFEGDGGRLATWLKEQEAYDLAFRGLRTMRNSEAHVVASSLDVQHGERAYSIFATGGDAGEVVPWILPPLAAEILPRSKKLDVIAGELEEWNLLGIGASGPPTSPSRLRTPESHSRA